MYAVPSLKTAYKARQRLGVLPAAALSAWIVCVLALAGIEKILGVKNPGAVLFSGCLIAIFLVLLAAIILGRTWFIAKQVKKFMLHGSKWQTVQTFNRYRRALRLSCCLLPVTLIWCCALPALQQRAEFHNVYEQNIKYVSKQAISLELRTVGYPRIKNTGLESFSWVLAETTAAPYVQIKVLLPESMTIAGQAAHKLHLKTMSFTETPLANSALQTHGANKDEQGLLATHLEQDAIFAEATKTISASELPQFAPGTSLWVSGSLKVTTLSTQEVAIFNAQQAYFVESSGLEAAFTQIRTQLRLFSAEHQGIELLPGFTVGDTALLSPQTIEKFRKTGLLHLTAVSGGNCALVISGAIAAVRFWGGGRKLRIATSLALLALFAFLVGPDASLLRATVMASVILVSKMGLNRATGLQALAAAVLVLLAVNPWQALQLGFALSVSASCTIILFAEAITCVLRKIAPPIIAVPLAVTSAAQLGAAPLLVLVNPEISIAAFPANLLAAAIAPLITGLGLVIAILLLPFPHIAAWFAKPAAFLCETIVKIAELNAQLPFATVPWPKGIVGAILLGAAEAALLGIARLLYLRAINLRHNPYTKPRFSKKQFIFCNLLVMFFVTLISSFSITAPLIKSSLLPTDWAVLACDIGQGDAILIRNPAHPQTAILVDTGDNSEKLIDCLQTAGIKQLAAIVLTHDDKDHVGAVAAVTHLSTKVVLAPQPTPRKIFTQLKTVPQQTIATQGQTLTVNPAGAANIAYTGTVHATNQTTLKTAEAPAVLCDILWPNGQDPPQETNQASLVMHCKLGNITALLLADTGKTEQQALLRKYGETLHADVVKIAHHGSKNHDPELIQKIGAKYAIFSVGANNRYGHPSSEALNSSIRAGATVLRTDTHGTIAITPQNAWVEKHTAQAEQKKARVEW